MKIAAWTGAWIVAWAVIEMLWMERHRRRAAERVWDGWVEIGFIGDGTTVTEYRVHPSNPAWRPRSLN